MTMITEPLFPVTAADVALTTDEWYTPRWLFEAAGLVFDMDVCAPVAPELRTCPAKRYLTVVEDGLTSPWEGLVWCNPPYSRAAPWVKRWAEHPSGLILLAARSSVRWQGTLLAAADALTLVSVNFGRPDGSQVDLQWAALLCARGEAAMEALARMANADQYVKGAYMARTMTTAIL